MFRWDGKSLYLDEFNSNIYHASISIKDVRGLLGIVNSKKNLLSVKYELNLATNIIANQSKMKKRALKILAPDGAGVGTAVHENYDT